MGEVYRVRDGASRDRDLELLGFTSRDMAFKQVGCLACFGFDVEGCCTDGCMQGNDIAYLDYDDYASGDDETSNVSSTITSLPTHQTSTPPSRSPAPLPPRLPTALEPSLLHSQAHHELTHAWTHFTQHSLAAAEVHAALAAEGFARVTGSHSPRTLDSLNLLGLTLLQQSKLAQAETTLRAALVGREKVLGQTHPDTLVSVANLGFVLARRGEWEAAEVCQRRVLQARVEGVAGSREGALRRRRDEVAVLASVGNLAYVLCSQGKFEEAAEMHAWEVEGYARLFGEGDARTVMGRGNLAFVEMCLGRWGGSSGGTDSDGGGDWLES
jgi:hypothetical protein